MMGKAGILSLVFFGLLAYINAIRHPFVHDDIVFILNNPHITDLNHWIDIFRSPAISGGLNTYYRPVLEILYRLEYHFLGPHPYAFHLFNIIVHIANGILLFGLLQKLGLRRAVAWVIACIFLIHPLQTEAVCCISGISNLWMTLSVLLALHAYLRRSYAVSLSFFVIAFFSREQGILFVPLVMVIDYSRGEKKYLTWAVWAFTAVVLLWLRQCMTGTAVFKGFWDSPGEMYLRLASIPRVIGMDLRMIFLPNDLHYYRCTDILQPNKLAWVLFIIGIGCIFSVIKRWPATRWAFLLGFGWFFAALLPVLNIVPLINEYSFIFTPEHFLYLPIVGILIIVVSGVDYILKQYRKLLLGLVISGCLSLTWYQNTFWNSEIALFERMLRFEPNFGRGHLLLAKAYYFKGFPREADGHFRKAYSIMSGYAKKSSNLTAEKFYMMYVKEILFDWAQNDSLMGQWQAALDKYKQEAAIDGGDAPLFNNIAFVYVNLGDKNNAIINFKKALQMDPSFVQARNNLVHLNPP